MTLEIYLGIAVLMGLLCFLVLYGTKADPHNYAIVAVYGLLWPISGLVTVAFILVLGPVLIAGRLHRADD